MDAATVASVPVPTTRDASRRDGHHSLVVTPVVVAHRGASGVRPEHTVAAYRTAIRQGVDQIELDLVATRDGVLVARHENELSRSTDVARHPRFKERRTRREVDGHMVTGWFCEDFTLTELKALGAREPDPLLRPHNTAYDGVEGVPSLSEVLAMVAAESRRRGAAVGVAIELKHVTHLARRGIDVVASLLATLARHGMAHPRSRVSVMSFETTVLRELAERTRVPLLQLVGALDDVPPDLRGSVDGGTTYRDLLTPGGLARVDEYADGLGLWHRLLGTMGPELSGELVRAAHRSWLTVHVWTLRAENRHLPARLRSSADPHARGDLATFARELLELGVDGLITDHPEQVLAVRDACG